MELFIVLCITKFTIHMLRENLVDKRIILASKSPRRQFLLKELGIDFEIRTKDTDESFSNSLKREEVAYYLAKKKADAFYNELFSDEILITADTIVCIDDLIVNKPVDKKDAIKMLTNLSGKVHTVYTGVCILSTQKSIVFTDKTNVHFSNFTKEEIEFYIDTYQPYDKAGAYGAQEWLGYVGIEKIEGSYFNVMGLPTHRIYKELLNFN
jgi:septum formation protein